MLQHEDSWARGEIHKLKESAGNTDERMAILESNDTLLRRVVNQIQGKIMCGQLFLLHDCEMNSASGF